MKQTYNFHTLFNRKQKVLIWLSVIVHSVIAIVQINWTLHAKTEQKISYQKQIPAPEQRPLETVMNISLFQEETATIHCADELLHIRQNGAKSLLASCISSTDGIQNVQAQEIVPLSQQDNSEESIIETTLFSNEAVVTSCEDGNIQVQRRSRTDLTVICRPVGRGPH